MKNLDELLYGLSYELNGPQAGLNWQVDELLFDSRKARDKAVFVAIIGTQTDGHHYIYKAIEQGCKIVVCEYLPKLMNEELLYIKVQNSKEALALMAANFYDHPSKDLIVVGVTGTNGKTSVATLLYQLFSKLGQKSGLISTVENKIGSQVLSSTHTTPDAVSLQALFAEMRDAAVDYVFMEVSSHACEQARIFAIDFNGAIFTNMSHDHLDYHGSFKNYIDAKKKFFDQLDQHAFALINIDDKRGPIMVQNTKAKVYHYALKGMAEFKAKIIENSLSGLLLELNSKEVYTRLVGDFNAYNLLAVYASALLLEEEETELLRVISSLQSAEGRFETVQVQGLDIIGIVDYAHTPDALEKVLQTLNRVCQKQERILTLVGCGGDRDKSKRPIMAKAACDYSHQVILTSDNPRTEDPELILREMEKGVPKHAVAKVLTISNRKQAIRTACQLAQKGDIILVAGKGHEKYQEINGVKHPFDDKEILREALTQRLSFETKH